MTDEEIEAFEEPKTFGLAKYRLTYSIIVILAITGGMVLDAEKPPIIYYVPILLLAIYLFFPFTYKLIVSTEAISSIDLFSAKTLEWMDISDIEHHNGNLLLTNRERDVKVKIHQQLDGYPEVINFIKLKRPDLWNLDETKIFHQSIFQPALLGIMGLLIICIVVVYPLENGLLSVQYLPILLFGLFIGVVSLWQGVKNVREISIETDYLIVKYIAWEQRIHFDEVHSVTLEQKMGKNEVSYPVHVRLENGNHIVIGRVKEGNSLLVSAIERWLRLYKPQRGNANDTE